MEECGSERKGSLQSCYNTPCGFFPFSSSWWNNGACVDSSKACCDVGPAYGGVSNIVVI